MKKTKYVAHVERATLPNGVAQAPDGVRGTGDTSPTNDGVIISVVRLHRLLFTNVCHPNKTSKLQLQAIRTSSPPKKKGRATQDKIIGKNDNHTTTMETILELHERRERHRECAARSASHMSGHGRVRDVSGCSATMVDCMETVQSRLVGLL